ncbi:D-2-hydroxyacid dehydrogenase [soil metagenome]
MASKPTIWCNADLSEEALDVLLEGTGGYELAFAGQATSNLVAGGHSEELEMAQIAFGQPDPGQAATTEGLRWVHITSAGYTRYDTPEFRDGLAKRKTLFTNSSSVFDDPCAQHVLAFMLAGARQLPQSLIEQRDGPRWHYQALRPATRLLKGQTVLILGFGAIGTRLAELLKPFDLNTVGFRRTVRGDEPIPTHPFEALDEWLPKADYILDLLPGHNSTNRFIDAARLAKMKPEAVFINIGRGTTVDQNALIEALKTGKLAAAYLDVTDPEPLPTDHPLWSTPNAYITPHIAGGYAGEILDLVRHFIANLRRYERGERLQDAVF